MTHETQFVPLASFANGFDADLVRARLEAEGIPVLLKGPQVGMFGAGFQGSFMGGAELFVPSPELERARALLEE
ncbi:MAG: hypothetical protein C0497_04475 [Gemmatimonas sp.]|nr:hypothetical protein [Gemmatimonas sp.]